MRKKYLSALLFGALLFASAGTFTSCKDYDDDINNLQSQINTINTTLSELKAQIGDGGVSSVTFDEATGVLTVVDANGTKTYTVKTSAGEVGEIKVTIDGQNLVVNGETVGKVGDTVTVNEDGYLCVNGTATEIKAGKYAILENISDNTYTITLPDENGDMQTIQLLRAVASNIQINPYAYYYGFYGFSEVEADYVDFSNIAEDERYGYVEENYGIAWGNATSDVNWDGPKGAIKNGQLLVGQVLEQSITVSPKTTALDEQSLKLVDSEGNYAPVIVTARPWGSYGPSLSGSRSVDSQGMWYLQIKMDESITKDNIGTAFAAMNPYNQQYYNKMYALSVNGEVSSDYIFRIDTDVEAFDFDAEPLNFTGKYYFNGAYTNQGYNLNSPIELKYIGSSIYDYKFSFTDADKNDADAWGITLKDNVLTASDKAAGKTIDLQVTVVSVNGTVKTFSNVMSIKFAGTTTEAGEIAASTYNVKVAEKNALVIDLGDTFSSLTSEQAISINDLLWTTTDDEFLLSPAANGVLTQFNSVKFYEDAACSTDKEVNFDDSAADIKKIKYAKISVDAYNPDATIGEHNMTLTLKANNNGTQNEIKKVTIPVNVTIPSFNDIFEKSGSWNDNELTLRLDGAGNAVMMTAYSMANPAILGTYPLAVTFDKINNQSVVTNNEAEFNSTTAPFQITNEVITNTHTLQNISAESVYTIQGVDGFTVKSGKYTIKFITALEGAKLVNYNDKSAAIDFKVEGDEITYNVAEKSGVQLVVNNKKYDLFDEAINGLTLDKDQWSFAFDAKAGDKAKAEFTAEGGIKITGLAVGSYTTVLTMTYKSAVTVGGESVYVKVPVSIQVVNQ